MTEESCIFKKLSNAVNQNIFPHNSYEIHHIDFKNFSTYFDLFYSCLKCSNMSGLDDGCNQYATINNTSKIDEDDLKKFTEELHNYLPFSLIIFSNNFKFLKDQRYAFLKNNENSLSVIRKFSNLNIGDETITSFSFDGVLVNSKLNNYVFQDDKFIEQVSYFFYRSKLTGNYSFFNFQSDEVAEFSISYYKDSTFESHNLVFHIFNNDGNYLIRKVISSQCPESFWSNGFINNAVHDFLLPFSIDVKKHKEIKNIRGFTKEYIKYFDENLKDVVEMIEY